MLADRILTESWKRKISEGNKGHVSWNQGLRYKRSAGKVGKDRLLIGKLPMLFGQSSGYLVLACAVLPKCAHRLAEFFIPRAVVVRNRTGCRWNGKPM